MARGQSKGTDMANVVKIPLNNQSDQGPNLNIGDDHSNTSRSNFSYRLFIIVDNPTFTMIEWLRESLEAPSYGDIVRQAVRALSIYLIENEGKSMPDCDQESKDPSGDEGLKRLNIRIPIQTKERLDILKERSGLTYTDIIIQGLRLLCARAKHEELLLESLDDSSKKGGGNDKPDRPSSKRFELVSQ